MNCFLQGLQVRGGHQHGRRMTVTGDPYDLVCLVSFLHKGGKLSLASLSGTVLMLKILA